MAPLNCYNIMIIFYVLLAVAGVAWLLMSGESSRHRSKYARPRRQF